MSVIVALTLLAAAPPDAVSGDRISRALGACRAIADDTARLACFDKAAGEFVRAVEKKDIRIVDKQEVRATRRSLFGFTLPRIGLFSDKDADEEEQEAAKEVDTTIDSLRDLGHDKYDLKMADGSTWRTTEPVAFPPKAGAKIHLRKAALGSYFLRIDRDRPVRAMRIQ